MTDRSTTPQRILEASRRLFNEQGYAATTQTEIARAIEISQGNLTYHFPTKRDLALHLEAEARQAVRAWKASFRPGAVTDDYVAHLLFAMNLTWENRFLFRDRPQYADGPSALRPDFDMAADFDDLHGLLVRIQKKGLFRRNLEVDLRVLTRSLWIVSRYWMDYLREFEELAHVTWADQERGIQHHFAVLLPNLTARARREFEAALVRASSRFASRGETARG